MDAGLESSTLLDKGGNGSSYEPVVTTHLVDKHVGRSGGVTVEGGGCLEGTEVVWAENLETSKDRVRRLIKWVEIETAAKKVARRGSRGAENARPF